MAEEQSTIDNLCINTIRTLSMDAIQKANSGHPGAPMGLAPTGYVLYTKFLKHNPENPSWLNRDRFVLSGGHASMLLYSLLHLTGYNLDLEDIKQFRQLNSKTPGHPEFGHTPGVETTTGPLGQGFANAVGMAMAECHLREQFNKPDFEIINHNTYVMCGDGDLMEGLSYEAASIAGHLGLAKLICLYDSNQITIEGKTSITFTEDIALRFKASNWHVIKVENGNDPDQITTAIQNANAETEKPTIIILSTNIAFGSPNKQDSSTSHGAPLGEDEVRLTKKNLGWPEDSSFLIPEDALKKFRECKTKGNKIEKQWKDMFKAYSKKFPELANNFVNAVSYFIPSNINDLLPKYLPSDKPIATRTASGKILNIISEVLPFLMGGSSDLAPSNNTYLNKFNVFEKNAFTGRNIHFGVREHAMTSLMTGMYLHGGIKPFGGTFLVFADYMRPAIRVAALMKLPVIYIFTHDSVAVGEDGPTHQPIEQIASLRCIPNLTVIRPADADETVAAWQIAITSTNTPTALILSRQKLPVLDKSNGQKIVTMGAYILEDTKGTPDIILIATGSEVHLAVEAKKALIKKNIKARVVSMPSQELFDQAPQYYKDKVLPPKVKMRIAIEAGIHTGWERYTKDNGIIIGISCFGASGPGDKVLEKFGFTVENIINKSVELLSK